MAVNPVDSSRRPAAFEEALARHPRPGQTAPSPHHELGREPRPIHSLEGCHFYVVQRAQASELEQEAAFEGREAEDGLCAQGRPVSEIPRTASGAQPLTRIARTPNEELSLTLESKDGVPYCALWRYTRSGPTGRWTAMKGDGAGVTLRPGEAEPLVKVLRYLRIPSQEDLVAQERCELARECEHGRKARVPVPGVVPATTDLQDAGMRSQQS